MHRYKEREVEHTMAVIACSLAGYHTVVGRWWNARPIRNALARYTTTSEDTIREALARLGVDVRKAGKGGQRWKLEAEKATAYCLRDAGNGARDHGGRVASSPAQRS